MGVAYALFSILLAMAAAAAGSSHCYKSIISFGDSLTDTGNLLRLSPNDKLPNCGRPPYGRTFFNRPTGRSSDGRIIIDFIAQSLGLPLVQPYMVAEEGGDFSGGVNFAVVGATAIDNAFYEKIGIYNSATNVSLGPQLDWLRQLLATLPDGRDYLGSSLVLMGEIGGNDYNHAIQQGKSFQVIKSFVPTVTSYIGSSIQELINLGAETILVPGIPPIGCLPAYLTQFKDSSTEKDYDPETGCLNWLNRLVRYHNKLLLEELSRLRELHPRVSIIYADYYNAALRLYQSPQQFGKFLTYNILSGNYIYHPSDIVKLQLNPSDYAGFTKGTILRACCGAGGLYNYNASAQCSLPPSTCCDDPSSFASWDGMHFTEAAYRFMTRALLEVPAYTYPQINITICSLLSK